MVYASSRKKPPYVRDWTFTLQQTASIEPFFVCWENANKAVEKDDAKRERESHHVIISKDHKPLVSFVFRPSKHNIPLPGVDHIRYSIWRLRLDSSTSIRKDFSVLKKCHQNTRTSHL
jgi:hypothetical protein